MYEEKDLDDILNQSKKIIKQIDRMKRVQEYGLDVPDCEDDPYGLWMFDTFRKTLWTFDNCDEVECDVSLINEDMMDAMWRNLDVYSYDINSFFLNKFIFYLKDKNRVIYKIYFSIEEGNVFLFSESSVGSDFVCGTIIVQNGKFIPMGSISDKYIEKIAYAHRKEGMSDDRQYIADRTLLNSLLYIIIVNQMTIQNKEIITETSKRIEVGNKKKSGKKKKNQPKKTKQIRYIKVDGVKVKKVQEEAERIEREQYERHTSEWSRRGHMRRVRSGEIKWIKPTTCKAKDNTGEKISKLYKIR